MDIPLAPEGIELAEKTGKALRDVPFDICFTSPLTRARQTAQCVLGDREIPVIPKISGSRRLTSEFWKELSLKMRRERWSQPRNG